MIGPPPLTRPAPGSGGQALHVGGAGIRHSGPLPPSKERDMPNVRDQEAERPIANVQDVIDFFDEHFIVIAVGFEHPPTGRPDDVGPAPQEQNDQP